MRRVFFLLLLLALPVGATDLQERNKALAKRAFEEVLAGGNKARVRGMTLWRIMDGRIKEEWSAFDQLSVMQQLGLLPAGK